MVDDTLDYATILHENMREFDKSLQLLKNKLKDIFSDGEDAKQMLIASYVNQTIDKWRNLMEIQKVLSNKIEQRTLQRSIEITGLPEEYGKNLADVASVLSKLLRIAITEYYVVDFKRIDELNAEKEIIYPRPLVVSLVDKNIKRRILSVAEMVTLKAPNSDLPVMITEHLTPLNKKLLKMAREEAALRGISKVWVQDGNIHYRRNDQSNIYEIRSDADIRSMSYL